MYLKIFLKCSPANTFPLVTLLSKDSFTGNLAAASTLIRLLIQSKKRDGFSQIPSKMQMLSDVPICTFLSGGIDSSLVTAVCAGHLAKSGEKLNTFSFDFTENKTYFKSNTFQPSQDRPFAEQMAELYETNHHFLECSSQDQLDYLYKAVDARDLPCMADVESSMLYFCSLVKQFNSVVLTGECADEIFGGYPWFHKKSSFETNMFPWSPSMQPRQALLDDDFIHELNMEEYALNAYEQTIRETPVLPDDSPEEKRRREIAYLNIRWFMATLLDRMDRAGMYSGLEARVPFADYRIVEYIFNIPWDIKCPDGIVKGLLRHAGEGILPKEILWRRKSPYPKTYDPHYEALLADQLKEVLASPMLLYEHFLIKRKYCVSLIRLPTTENHGMGSLWQDLRCLLICCRSIIGWKKWKHPLPSGCS